jgi:cytochrome o ubiquinol oxidase subunit 1
MPKNTAVGFVIGIFAFIFSFAMVWHIWWLALAGLGCVLVTLIMRSFDYNTDYYVTASEVEATEMKYQQARVGDK